MKPICLLLVVLLLPSFHALTTQSGTFISGTSLNPYTYIHSFSGGANTICKIQFMATTPSTNTRQSYSALLAARTSPLTLPTSPTSYDHQNPLLFTDRDLENANRGQKQTVQITGLVSGNAVNINVAFLTSASFSWTITITEEVGTNPASFCVNTGKVTPLNQYCTNCLGLTAIGAYCDILDVGLSNSSLYTVAINGGSYKAFTIPGSSSQINLEYSSDLTNLQVFIQFKTYTNELAGLMNYVISPGGSANYFILSNAQTYGVIINSGGSDVSVAVINQNAPGNTANFNIRYTTQQSLNVLVIVLGVLGGLLLIALIVAAFFIIRRIRSPNQVIHPNSSGALGRTSLIQQNMLTAEEIEVYFPSISCRIAFTEMESSSMNLKEQQAIDRDCVICLCPIDGNELMKVTFCRHIFHAHCLIQWFKKQRNCPYCREEYSKSSTVQHYQHLLKETGKNMLAGVELAQAILKTKIKSSVIIEDLKD